MGFNNLIAERITSICVKNFSMHTFYLFMDKINCFNRKCIETLINKL